jgi:hypothetical protein
VHGEVRYVHVKHALISASGSDWTRNGDKSGVCSSAHFDALRDTAYRLYDVPHVPAHLQPRMLLSVVVKTERDKRRMIFSRDVAEAVQQKYHLDVEFHVAANEEQSVQLDWLARTSIFVCNIGSPSFRLVLLPDGAQVHKLRLVAGSCCCRCACSQNASQLP